MAYTASTTLPLLNIFQWSTPDDPNPKLSQPVGDTDTTIYWTSIPKDYTGATITGNFLMNAKNNLGYTEQIYVPAGKVHADGLGADDVIRGVRLNGLDYTTGDSSLAVALNQDTPIGCVVSPVHAYLWIRAIQGGVATGSGEIKIGDLTAADQKIAFANDHTSLPGLIWDDSLKRVVLTWGDDAPAAGNLDGVGIPVLTTAERDAMTWGANGAFIVNSSINKYQVRLSSGWHDVGTATGGDVLVGVTGADTTPSYLDDKITTGVGTKKTVVNPAGNEELNIEVDLTDKNAFISEPETYTPAYLVGGTNTTAWGIDWTTVTDGAFDIDIDGVTVNVTGCNFNGDSNHTDAAATIQAAIRTATGSLETCTWETDHFKFTSVDTTSSSAITVLSTPSSGTDISGAGAKDFMDCDSGNGVVTDKVLDQTADVGKGVVLESDGKLNELLLPVTSTVQEFSSSGTWVKPAYGTYAYIVCYGAGGGGGGGCLGTDDNSSGGCGGGGGARITKFIPLALLGATETVTVGVGGVGGASRPASTTSVDGYGGGIGGNTTFGSHLFAGGGRNGLGGTIGSTTRKGGNGGCSRINYAHSPLFDVVTQYSVGTQSGQGTSTADGGSAEYGGAAGGGIKSGGQNYNGGCSLYGGCGGASGGRAHYNSYATQGGLQHSIDRISGGCPGAGANGNVNFGGSGGASGAGTQGTGHAGNGSNGGSHGGGGGGGGAARNNGTSNSGKGGDGGNGHCYVYVW